MAETHAFPSLLKSVLVAVNLGQYGAELHLQSRDNDELAHTVAD